MGPATKVTILHTQTAYAQDAQGRSCDFGAAMLPDETCASTVAAFTAALHMARDAAEGLLEPSELDQL